MAIVSYLENELPPMTPEREARLKALAEMPDYEIDYSDIPELTDEELAGFRPHDEVMAEWRELKKQVTTV